MHVLDFVDNYVAQGWSVIPQIPGTKRPCVTWKERRAQRGTDRSWARDWWLKRPNHGVLLVLGPASEIVVVDCDGVSGYTALQQHLGVIPETVAVKSGNPDPFRFHLIFRLLPGLVSTAKITPWSPNLEFRGDGGLAVLPPSCHASGNTYCFFAGRAPWECPIAPLPDLIASEFKLAAEKRASARSTPDRGPQPTGKSLTLLPGLSFATREFLSGRCANGPNWNARLYRAACNLAAHNVLLSDALPALLAAAKPWTTADGSAAIATIRSAYSQPCV